MKALIGTFNQEKALILRDCEIFANLRLQLYRGSPLFRNILRVLHSCWIVALAKLVQTPALFRLLYQLDPAAQLPPNPSSAAALPVTCQLLCTADTFLMSVTMFYISTLAIYVFCRPAQPDFPAHYNKVEQEK